jgi:hypothetical protein
VKTLDDILRQHYQPAGLAGGRSLSPLERDLRRHARLNAIAYGTVLVLLVAIVLGSGVMLVYAARACQEPHSGVLAGAGISIPLLLGLTRRTAREWSQASLVAVLCRRMDANQLQAVLEKLLAPDAAALAKRNGETGGPARKADAPPS